MADRTAQELGNLGQEAAGLWLKKAQPTLTMAAAAVVKRAGHMNREQITRVVEATNHAAYQAVHNDGKLASEGHRYVSFFGGPARLEDVIKQATGLPEPIQYRDLSDYKNAPPAHQKEASWEQVFGVEKFAFSSDAEGVPRDPALPLVPLYHKLAVLVSEAENEVEGGDRALEMHKGQLVEEMKVAHLEGATLNDIVRALGSVSTEPAYLKVAFSMAAPHLMRAGQHTPASYADSMKTASPGVMNPEHPLRGAYAAFIGSAAKLAAARAVHAELSKDLADLRQGILQIEKMAAEDPSMAARAAEQVKKMMGAYKGFADNVGNVAGDFGKHMGGEGSLAHTGGKLVGTGIKALPWLAGGALAYRGVQHARAAADSPLGRKVMSFIPGTDENQMDEMRIRQMYGAQPDYGMMGYLHADHGSLGLRGQNSGARRRRVCWHGGKGHRGCRSRRCCNRRGHGCHPRLQRAHEGPRLQGDDEVPLQLRPALPA